jgi:hypothetical protein
MPAGAALSVPASGSWKSALAFLPALMLLASQAMSSPPGTQSGFSTEEEMKADVDAVPCKDSDRLNAVRSLFEKMGADASDVSVATYKRVQNVVVTRRGASDERIVIGAHYDKTGRGCGALDNWTGIVAIAHIYKTLKAVKLTKTLVFVAFGKEEEGLVGSHAMVDAIPKEELRLYCGMVNIDSLGMAIPQVADNMSSKKLEELAGGLAKQMSIHYGHATVAYALADSNSFLARKIPALTIHGMGNDWSSILHTAADQRSKVNSTSVYLGYRLALAVVYSIDKASCDAFR